MGSYFIIQVLIINNVGFGQHLSQDYWNNMHVIEITKEFCTPNEQSVKYFHFFSRFREDSLLDYKFDAISAPLVSRSHIGINPDLYQVRNDPFVITHGLLDELNDEVVKEFWGIGIKIIPRVIKFTSKVDHNIFYSSEEKMPMLIGLVSEDAIARLENGINSKTGDEFVRNLHRIEVSELTDLKKSKFWII